MPFAHRFCVVGIGNTKITKKDLLHFGKTVYTKFKKAEISRQNDGKMNVLIFYGQLLESEALL